MIRDCELDGAIDITQHAMLEPLLAAWQVITPTRHPPRCLFLICFHPHAAASGKPDMFHTPPSWCCTEGASIGRMKAASGATKLNRAARSTPQSGCRDELAAGTILHILSMRVHINGYDTITPCVASSASKMSTDCDSVTKGARCDFGVSAVFK